MPKSFRQTIGLSPSTVDVSSGSALLVIDPQRTYATGGPLAITGIDASQAVISDLVEKYRKVSICPRCCSDTPDSADTDASVAFPAPSRQVRP